MEKDNRNSSESSSPSGKPPRSKLERAVVWTVIGALIVITGMEALARTSYAKTLANLETAITETKEPLTLNHFKSNLKNGLAIQTQGDREGVSTILFRWPSLLKKYELHLTVSQDEEQTLATYSTSDGPAAVINQPIAGGDETVDEEQAEGGGGMGPGEGGGGPGGQGGGRRGPRNPLQRLVSEAVVAELQLSDEQKTQLEDLIESQPAPDPSQPAEEIAQQQETQRKEVQEKLKELLNEQQFTRARQILLHARGAEALTQEDVAQELKLTLEQLEQIASLVADQREKMQQSEGPARAAIREETATQILAVLTAEQKQAWETLLGPAPPAPERGNRPQRPE